MPRNAAGPTSLRVDVIDTDAGFAALRSEWTQLLGASTVQGPFLSWEWLYAWWTHMRGSRALRLLTVRDGNDLVGIAPFARARAPLPWLSRLEFLGTGYAGSDYLDII